MKVSTSGRRGPVKFIFIKRTKEASGHKIRKERLTVILCSKAAGHMVTTGTVYTVENLGALKNKSKDSRTSWT